MCHVSRGWESGNTFSERVPNFSVEDPADKGPKTITTPFNKEGRKVGPKVSFTFCEDDHYHPPKGIRVFYRGHRGTLPMCGILVPPGGLEE